ncbi:MAG TPA: TIGR00725 family protein [Thermoanaerobaculia bacterium]|jgi:hypothetical protein
MNRKPVVGVVGGGGRTAPEGSTVYRLAYETGALVARRGAVLLCGGRDGVMEAAAKGAREAGGPTVGILPGRDPRQGNPYLDCAIATGLRDGRNWINAHASDVLIALEGGPGTLSEIGLALKIGKPVVYLGYWEFLNACRALTAPFARTAGEAVERAFALLGRGLAGSFPEVEGQSAQKRQFEQFLKRVDRTL